MREAFPDDPKISSFSQRYVHETFDPTAIRPLVSPTTQTRPRARSSIEGPPSRQPTPPAIQVTSNTGSPKRPPPSDEPEPDTVRPRKLPRGESPLAGAAGRRLKQSRLQMDSTPLQGAGATSFAAAPPPVVPGHVNLLLSMIPPASAYHALQFRPDAMVRLLRDTQLPALAGPPKAVQRQVGQGLPAGYGPLQYQGMQ